MTHPQQIKTNAQSSKWTLCCDVQVAYRTVHQWARSRLKGKLKVQRPVSEKLKPGALEEFKKNCNPQSKPL